MRVMITGISGFVGNHLRARLMDLGHEILGLDLKPIPGCRDPSLILHDLAGSSPLGGVIGDWEPDQIYHLAAVYGDVPRERMYALNVRGTAKLLEGIRTSGISTSLFLASSSAVYGATLPLQNPISETQPAKPNTDYGRTKLEQELLAFKAQDEWGLPLTIARTFNLSGPGLPPSLLPSSVAKQIALSEIGRGPGRIQVGDLRPKRDYLDVRDAVAAYTGLMSSARRETVYNVCSGQSHSMMEVVGNLLKMSHVPVDVRQIPDTARTGEVSDQMGDFGRLLGTTGWAPQIPFGDSLADLLEDWRMKLASEEGC